MILGLAMFLTPMIAARVFAAADPYGLDTTAKATPFAQSKKTLPELVGTIISAGLSLVGVIFLILAVYGGFKWMTARGEAGSAKEGRDTIIDATIGILLVLGAYAMTNFIFTDVVSKLGGG